LARELVVVDLFGVLRAVHLAVGELGLDERTLSGIVAPFLDACGDVLVKEKVFQTR
jgi:hypothetical protein